MFIVKPKGMDQNSCDINYPLSFYPNYALKIFDVDRVARIASPLARGHSCT